jgi:hypothetical protein
MEKQWDRQGQGIIARYKVSHQCVTTITVTVFFFFFFFDYQTI